MFEILPDRTLFLLVGPTCTGKSTLEKALNAKGMPSLRSFTTRAMRVGEVDGVDYDFLTKDAAAALFNQGKIVQSVNFNGNFYGTTADGLAAAFAGGDRAVVVVEPTGVTQFKAYAQARDPSLKIVTVFLQNTLETLTQRLIARYKGDKGADRAYYWDRLLGLEEEQATWLYYPGITWDIFYPIHEDATGVRFSTANAADMVFTYRS